MLRFLVNPTFVGQAIVPAAGFRAGSPKAGRIAGCRQECLPHKLLVLFLTVCSIAHAEPADWIYTARYVVTMDAQHRLIDDGGIAIRADKIVAVGKRVDIEKQFQSKQRVDRPTALIMPGLINTHTHAGMSLLRGIADDLRR